MTARTNGSYLKIAGAIAASLAVLAIGAMASHMMRAEVHEDERTKVNRIKVLVEERLDVRLGKIESKLDALQRLVLEARGEAK